MLTYAEVFAHHPTGVVVWRTRVGDGPDVYAGRDPRTERVTEGHASLRAVLLALGVR